MQPQANRERIIIRTSLAHALPPVIADARALRQIALNLIGNSIHLANAGGQVIVSTALSDFGEVVLRVRDTGHGLNDNEVAAAMEPFRTHAPSDQASDGSGVSLSLTKALVEANRAQFHIKTGAAFRHPDRSGVFARDGEGVGAADFRSQLVLVRGLRARGLTVVCRHFGASQQPSRLRRLTRLQELT